MIPVAFYSQDGLIVLSLNMPHVPSKGDYVDFLGRAMEVTKVVWNIDSERNPTTVAWVFLNIHLK